MNEIDDKILAALRAESEASAGDYSEELGMFGLIRESFRGTLGIWVAVVFVLVLVFLGAFIYCAIEFFHAPDISAKLNWLAGGLLAAMVVITLRLWFFMELNRTSVVREIKRVELQLALLARKIDAPTPGADRSGS